MEMIFTGAVIFIGSLLQGVFGFAFVLFATPILSLYLPIKTVAPLLALFLPLLTGVLAVNLRSNFVLANSVPLLVGAIFGAPLGIYLLGSFDDGLVKLALGLFLVVYSAYSLYTSKVMMSFPFWSSGIFGALGGLLGGVFNTSAPPVALYVSSHDWPSQQKRAVLNVFVLTTSIVVLCFHMISENFTYDIMVTFVYLLPAMLAGMITGRWLSKTVNEEKYSKGLYIFLLIIGFELIRHQLDYFM
ncbi:hypothetical protein MNBD_NITROSPINAE03-1297 [hydrothermal vent metagenome]|uniref:Membrane transporter protein n=1 Tax=hydrothermal vent metagenome TaxID=652676 RepID=A0A3B1BH07_9ZZZZ